MIAFDELSTYSLSDFIPITLDMYFRLFERQNEQWWPLILVGSLSAFYISVRAWQGKLRCILSFMAICSLFVGISFYWVLLQELAWIAKYYAWGFIVYSLLLIAMEFKTWNIQIASIDRGKNLDKYIGLGLLLQAFVLFPLLPVWTERPLNTADLLLSSPDATMVMCCGLILIMPRITNVLLVFPAACCLVNALIYYAMNWLWGLIMCLFPLVTIAVMYCVYCVKYFTRNKTSMS